MGFSALDKNKPVKLALPHAPALRKVAKQVHASLMGLKEKDYPEDTGNVFPQLSQPMKAAFFTSTKGPNWEHYTCSNPFLSREAAVVDHDIADLLRPAATIPNSISVTMSDLEKEEVLTRSALITCSKSVLCQEAVFALSTIHEGELDEMSEAEKCAWYEDRFFRIQRILKGVAEGTRDTIQMNYRSLANQVLRRRDALLKLCHFDQVFLSDLRVRPVNTNRLFDSAITKVKKRAIDLGYDPSKPRPVQMSATAPKKFDKPKPSYQHQPLPQTSGYSRGNRGGRGNFQRGGVGRGSSGQGGGTKKPPAPAAKAHP